MKQGKSRTLKRLVALVLMTLAVVFVVNNELERSRVAENNRAIETCMNRKLNPTTIIDTCTQLIDAGVSSVQTLAAFHVRRGYALYRLDKAAEALIDFNQAVELDPENFQSWQGKSFALDMLDKDLEALAAVEQSLAIAPTQTYSARRKFRILTKLGRFEEADAYYTRLMKQYPPSENPRNYWMPQQLGKLRLALDQPAVAAEVLKIAVQSKPSDQKSRQLFFRACYELGSDCPRLLPETDAVVEEADCDATTGQLAERFPKFWESLHPESRESDPARELQANTARLQLIQAGYVTYATGLQLGDEGETPEDEFLLFERVLSCVEDGDLFNPVELVGPSEDKQLSFADTVRNNMVDLARYMRTKGK